MPDDAPPRLCRVAGRAQWHIRHAGIRRSTGCTDRADAERVLAAYRRDLDRPQLASVTTAAILAAYLDDRRDKHLPGVARLGYAHKQLARAFGQQPPEALTEKALRGYVLARLDDGIAPATARTELQALRAALRWAGAQHLIATVPAVPLPPRPEPRDRWLTRDEAERLLAACHDPHLRLFVLLALHTAARSAAILGLTWSRVDLEGRRIDLRTKSTTKRGARVPINDTLLAALLPASELATCAYVVEWGGDRVQRVIKGFRAAARRAGLPDVTPHTLRHTAATWMAQAGVPLWEIAGFMGHTSTRMLQDTYGHHSPDHMAKAAKALG